MRRRVTIHTVYGTFHTQPAPGGWEVIYNDYVVAQRATKRQAATLVVDTMFMLAQAAVIIEHASDSTHPNP